MALLEPTPQAAVWVTGNEAHKAKGRSLPLGEADSRGLVDSGVAVLKVACLSYPSVLYTDSEQMTPINHSACTHPPPRKKAKSGDRADFFRVESHRGLAVHPHPPLTS